MLILAPMHVGHVYKMEFQFVTKLYQELLFVNLRVTIVYFWVWPLVVIFKTTRPITDYVFH